MSSNDKPNIRIGDMLFREVTNETSCGEIFSYKEAYVYGTTGQRIYSTVGEE